MPDVHPAIAKKIDELLAEARKLIESHEQGLIILTKTIEIRDVHGLKMRIQESLDFGARMQWIVAQLDALRSIPYDMAVDDVTARRRISTSTLPAVRVPKKDGDGE